MDLQYSKWQIDLKIEDFVFFDLHFAQKFAFLHNSKPLYPIHDLQSAVLVFFLFAQPFF